MQSNFHIQQIDIDLFRLWRPNWAYMSIYTVSQIRAQTQSHQMAPHSLLIMQFYLNLWNTCNQIFKVQRWIIVIILILSKSSLLWAMPFVIIYRTMTCFPNHICHLCTYVDIREEIAMIEEGKMDIAINPLKVWIGLQYPINQQNSCVSPRMGCLE